MTPVRQPTDHDCPNAALIRQNNRELFGNGNKGLVKELHM